MSSPLTMVAERLVDLQGQTAGSAAARLVQVASAQGYTVAATAAGTYRLARTRRRMLVSKRTESVVITIFSDRTGTKARIIGALDELVVAHLAAPPTHAASSTNAASSSPQPTPRPVPPTAAPAEPLAAPPQPTPDVEPAAEPVGAAWWGSASVSVPTQPEMHTVTRPVDARLTLPDGRVIPLDAPIVVGRNPDPALGPHGSRPIPISDPSVSKSHAAIHLDGGDLIVIDLHSTNGTAIGTAASTVACTPGRPSRAPIGSTVVTGDVTIQSGVVR